MKLLIKSFVVTLTALAFSTATAQTCPTHFAAGQAPVVKSQSIQNGTITLCYSGFSLGYTSVSRTSLWSAEHLTDQRVQQARGMKRTDNFHPDENLPVGQRAELSSYVRSGYDRGHLSPSGDMFDATSQSESFSLANIVPQNPNNNQNLWQGIEASTRNLAQARQGSLYVVTGPIYQGNQVQQLKGGILIPTGLYKALYDERTQQASAYIANNLPGMAYQVISISELEKLIGIDVFPGLSASIKAVKINLPEPKPHGHSNYSTAGSGERVTQNIPQTAEKHLTDLYKVTKKLKSFF